MSNLLNNMKIAIDGRFWGLENTGLGRYTMGLVNSLDKISKKNTDIQFYLLLRKKWFDQFDKLNLGVNFYPVLAEIPHYSFKEQAVLPKILAEIQPDLFHALHFNVPLAWRGKTIVTIHDLITQFSVGAAATTLPKYKYFFKWYVHNFVLCWAIEKSSAILTPSEFTKQQIVQEYGVATNKIHVAYEGVDEVYSQKNSQKENVLKKYQVGKYPYLVYTGNVYPHKNIPVLLEGLKMYNQKAKTPYHLLVVCSRSVFAQRLEKLIKDKNLQEWVHFLGFVPDEDLREIYRGSRAFVTPSKLEGFGLPGLEAMAAGTIVIAAKASCLPEIYGQQAWFFDPDDPSDLAGKIAKLEKTNAKKRSAIIVESIKYVDKFSWDKLGKGTLEVYRQNQG